MTIPNTMKSPRDRRPVWRGGVMQIHVTRACDKACFNCTQGSQLAGKPIVMTVENFELACKSLAGYWGVVGMFGGNPTMHPQFDELCAIMKRYVPFVQRGIWCNNPRGKAGVMRSTFNPEFSNLNVHEDQDAATEFRRDWPECARFVKGHDTDSRHGPVFGNLKRLVPDDAERYALIGNCDINQYWSAMVCQVRGELRGFFCEIAGAQAMLTQNRPDFVDTGLVCIPGWWNQPMSAFESQVHAHCNMCLVPMRAYGQLANGGTEEQTTSEYADVYVPKKGNRPVRLVESRGDLAEGSLGKATDYIQNGSV